MTLPGTGPLSFSAIYAEIYGSHSTQQASLRSMSSAASKDVPDAVSEFYGYSHDPGADVEVGYDPALKDIEWLIESPEQKEAWRTLDIVGQTSPQVLTIEFDTVLTTSTGDVTGDVKYAIGTGSWQSGSSHLGAGSKSFSISNIQPGNLVKIKIHLRTLASDRSGTLSAHIDSASFSQGSGTIDLVSPTGWSLNVNSAFSPP
jgi:hypothetical protein